MLTSVELEIELFCRGLVIDPAVQRDMDARRIARTRAGLGSGLEIVLHAPGRGVWVNVPVLEPFAAGSPFRLEVYDDAYVIRDTRPAGGMYPVTIPAEPSWYSRETASGTLMSRIGVLQGTYLGVYISNVCLYWACRPEPLNCRFCTTGKNVGVNEEGRKSVEDVVEVARAAREESHVIFTHFNTGYRHEDDPARRREHGLMQLAPYVRAVRDEVGGFVGVQAVPVTRANYDEYDEVIEAGADHFSFCVEFEDPEVFARICPGKAATLGQGAFYDAMAYTSAKLGVGRVSGEIIAGLEPVEMTKRAIDRIVGTGAFPTVCIFRPLVGSELADVPPPDPEDMKDVMAYQYAACRRAKIPIGVLPGIQVSLVVQPEESRSLVHGRPLIDPYEVRLGAMRAAAPLVTAIKSRPRHPRRRATSGC
jgi:hypothetical protein